MRRAWWRWMAGIGWVVAAACADGGAAGADPDGADGSDTEVGTDTESAGQDGLPVGAWRDFDATADGPFGVGFRTWTHSYTPVDGQTPREITVSVWYPTLDTEGEPATYYIMPGEDEEAFVNASLAPSVHAEGYPLQAYTHGDQGWGATSADLMRNLASHGWVAVAPDHTDNLLFNTIDPPLPGHWYHRGLDVIEAVDQVLADPELGPGTDGSAYVLSGHSRGATTVWTVSGATFDPAQQSSWCDGCSAEELALFDGSGARSVADPRVVSAIPMAGGIRRSFFGDQGHTSVDVPMLFLSGTDDPIGQQEVYESTAPIPMIWADLEGACHTAFSSGGCPGGVALDQELFEVVNAYALAFSRATLLEDDTPQVLGILDGTVEVSERVSLQVRL